MTSIPANLKLAGVIQTSLGDSSHWLECPRREGGGGNWLENWLPGRGVVAPQPGAMVGRWNRVVGAPRPSITPHALESDLLIGALSGFPTIGRQISAKIIRTKMDPG